MKPLICSSTVRLTTRWPTKFETYQGGCNKDDQTSGVHVLRYFQRRFAPVDDIDEQVEARRNLEALARSDNEWMTHFNARFNAQVQYVRSCGIPILPRDHLPQYLRTLRSCEVGIPNALHPASPLPLLTSKKDSNNAQRDQRSQETSTGRHQQSTQHDPHHSSSAANASSESPVVHSRTVECWSCGEIIH
jgi:hypothetical protein